MQGDVRDLARRWERSLRRALPAVRREALRLERGALRRPERFHDLGVALDAWRRSGRFRLLGFRSFTAYLRARGGMSRATAYKLMAVASGMDRATANALGLERAYAATRLGPRGTALAADSSVRALRARATATPGRAAGAAARALAAALRAPLGDRGRVRASRRGKGWRIALELNVEDARTLARLVRAPRRSP